MRIWIIILCLLSLASLQSQGIAQEYWLLLEAKDISQLERLDPREVLSERALNRRQNQGIALDHIDLPISPRILKDLSEVPCLKVLKTSRWLNAIAVTSQSDCVEELLQKEYIRRIVPSQALKYQARDLETKPARLTAFNFRSAIDYGASANQIFDLNGQALHAAGYEGDGIVMAIMDSGFGEVDEMSSFEHLFDEGRILSTMDFVEGDTNVYNESSHGRFVLSCIAGIKEGEAYGSATQASFHLLRTEDTGSETPVEEFNWIAAAEYADSAGVDILSTSLGYIAYDDSTDSYSYADMDGNTAFITRAADIAASKGILVVNSAGNSGSNDFRYIGAPADADSVLAIGSVDADSLHTSYSSFGPSFDGRVKPNVCAQGRATIGINELDEVVEINGTSFAAPIISGLAACLWQSIPEASNMQVFDAIQMSAHLYDSPNDSLGHGIPDFDKARDILDDMVYGELPETGVIIYPNPSSDQLSVLLPQGEEIESLSVHDLLGRKHLQDYEVIGAGRIAVDITGLRPGIYILSIEKGGEAEHISWLKL